MRPFVILLAITWVAALASPNLAGADDWEDPGSVDEALCQVDHRLEDHSGEQAVGFTFDGVPFSGSILTGVDFTTASLACIPDDAGLTCDGRCVSFTSSQLDGAIFDGANATGASFNSADLAGTSWNGSQVGGAAFDSSDLSGAFVLGWVADGASFVSANLADLKATATKDGVPSFAGADFRGTTLLRVDFRSSDPDQYRTDFTGADFRGSLADCRYEEVDVEVENEDGEIVTETEVVVSDCPDFRGAIFSNADFRSISWTGGRFDEADFTGADTNLAGSSFKEGDFVGADFSGLVFEEAVIRDGLFVAPDPVDAGLYLAAVFTGSDMRNADLPGAVLTHPMPLVDTDEDGDVCDEIMGHVDWSGIAGSPAAPAADRAMLRAVYAPGIDFKDLQLGSATLILGDLRCADLRGADLSRAAISGLDLGGAILGDGSDNASAANALGGCTIPAAPIGEFPNPLCTRFDGVQAEGLDLSGARLDATTFVGADLTDADLSSVTSACLDITVDPDLNEGVSVRQYCPDFRRANLSGTDLSPVSMQGPDFREVRADESSPLDLTEFSGSCVTGLVPGTGGDVDSFDFCPRFEGAVLPGVVFHDALLEDAVFGCLEPEEDSTTFPDCTDLRGADLSDLTAIDSRWVAVDLSDDAGPASRFDGADVSGAAFTCQGFSYEEFDDMVPPEVTAVQASLECIDFKGAVLTPDFLAAGASFEGVDWSAHDGWIPDLTGADLSSAIFGCFEFDYDDENGDPQTLTECSRTDGATLFSVDFTGASFEGMNFSGANLTRALLTDATFDAETRFAADYVPDPGDTGDAIKDNCTTAGSPTDLRMADLRGADLTEVIDFGGGCILVNEFTVYSETTQGLTDAVKAEMTLFVPEPAAAAAQFAALSTLALLARRRRRSQG